MASIELWIQWRNAHGPNLRIVWLIIMESIFARKLYRDKQQLREPLYWKRWKRGKELCTSTTLAKKLRQARTSNYRRVHAREITRLCPLARGCPNFFGQGSMFVHPNKMIFPLLKSSLENICNFWEFSICNREFSPVLLHWTVSTHPAVFFFCWTASCST